MVSRTVGWREGWRLDCPWYGWVCGPSSDPLAEGGIGFPIRPFESLASSLQINTGSALSGSSHSLPQWLRQRWGKSCLCALHSHSAFAAAGVVIIIVSTCIGTCTQIHTMATFSELFPPTMSFKEPLCATAGTLFCSYHQKLLVQCLSLVCPHWPLTLDFKAFSLHATTKHWILPALAWGHSLHKPRRWLWCGWRCRHNHFFLYKLCKDIVITL